MEISGIVSSIRYFNNESGYSVISIQTYDNDNITCVGILPNIDTGISLSLEGDFTVHPIYGEQFNFSDFNIKRPEKAEDILLYLSSGSIKGIRRKMAEKIVERFGDESLELMENEPETVATLKGISLKKAKEISAQLKAGKQNRESIILLQKQGIDLGIAIKLYQHYGEKVFNVLKRNPYQIIYDVKGIGFITADKIALSQGYQYNSPKRLASGVFYVLNQATQVDGHAFLPFDYLFEKASEYLNVTDEELNNCIIELSLSDNVKIVEDEENKGDTLMYPAHMYYEEIGIASALHRLDKIYDHNEKNILNQIKKISSELNIVADENQQNAILEGVRRGFLVITGGPGTGKTTVINSIIKIFEGQGKRILLAAPTGRAAKRMSEATNHEASTVHRLLEVNSEGGANKSTLFNHNSENPLDADMIIIDEVSMLDLHLTYHLLKAVPNNCRLIFTGDSDQLPSVGPGTVLRDIISSNEFKVVRLNHIFRQSNMSDIVENAHKINQGICPQLFNNNNDFYFIPRDNINSLLSSLLSLILYKLPKTLKIEPIDIQVLSPMRKGPLGVLNLNSLIQQYINPEDESKNQYNPTNSESVFREGDKVMQVKNNYNLTWEERAENGTIIERGAGVFNGDVGIISDINNYTSTITVVYDDSRYVEYPFALCNELELAYAITIHKSQGSEYSAVIIPLLGGPPMLLNRNLLYTAITRAKRFVVILGSDETVKSMVNRIDTNKRNSSLDKRIIEHNNEFNIENTDERLFEVDVINPLSTDEEI